MIELTYVGQYRSLAAVGLTTLPAPKAVLCTSRVLGSALMQSKVCLRSTLRSLDLFNTPWPAEVSTSGCQLTNDVGLITALLFPTDSSMHYCFLLTHY